MLIPTFRMWLAFAGLLIINTIALAETKTTPAASKSSAPASSAYTCNSKIAGTIPQVGPVHHSSVAICPAGQKPTITQNGTSVNNPKCTYYGTQPGTSTFQVETKRSAVSCQPAQAPASVVQQRVDTFNQKYNIISNNCQHAANKTTKK